MRRKQKSSFFNFLLSAFDQANFVWVDNEPNSMSCSLIPLFNILFHRLKFKNMTDEQFDKLFELLTEIKNSIDNLVDDNVEKQKSLNKIYHELGAIDDSIKDLK